MTGAQPISDSNANSTFFAAANGAMVPMASLVTRDEIDGCGIGVWLGDGSLLRTRHCNELADQSIQMFCRSLDLGDGLNISRTNARPRAAAAPDGRATKPEVSSSDAKRRR